jgi:glycine/D-amino acid oxidase-like deaminating enzyme
MTATFDCAVVGAGVMGCTTALFLARAGMRVALVDRGPICRQASGVNAGTLTLQMVRAALIPYAVRAVEMWHDTPGWLDGADVGARRQPGLSVAFTDAEAAMLEDRVRVRRQAGAPLELVGPARAREIEPGLNPAVKCAGLCPADGFAAAYLTARAYRPALLDAGVVLHEHCAVEAVDPGFVLRAAGTRIAASRIVLAGGVWLEPMAAWFGLHLPIKTRINQVAVTAPMPPVMRTVLGVASGLLSLKQFDHGGVVIGGGWQGIGSRERGPIAPRTENLLGNVRLAAHTIPALRDAQILRSWVGLESETADALPVLGALPGVPDAWIIGCAQSGYTSGPYLGKLLAQAILGQSPELPLFPPDRLLSRRSA